MVRARERQGGFLIVAVMVLLLVVVVTSTWLLTSASYRSTVAQRQIDAYQHHHEMLSVRHIALRWMVRQRGLSELEEMAGDPGAIGGPPTVYDATLPDGLSVRITLERGQGLPSRDLEGATNDTQRELMESLLSELGRMVDLRAYSRSVGPVRMVLSSTPDEVIEAIGAGRPSVADALRRARSEGQDATGQIQTTLQNFGVDLELARAIATELFAGETRLWKLTAYTEREGNQRVYRLYMMQDADGPQMLAWKILEATLIDGPSDDQMASDPASAGGLSARSPRVR
ncbi:MAG: hypothetical protein Tsb0013_15500 [Phycisphaerales bacterium]